MASEDKTENLKEGDTGAAKAGGGDLFKQIGALSDKAHEQDLKLNRDKFSMTQIPAAGGQDKGTGGAGKGAENKFSLYDSGKGAEGEKAENPLFDGVPEPLKKGIESAIQSIQGFEQWVRGQGSGPLKEQAEQALGELKRLCFGDEHKGQHEGAKMPDGSFKDFKTGRQDLKEEAEYLGGLGVGIYKGADHVGQGFSAGNTKALVDDLADALTTSGQYWSEKFKQKDTASVVKDTGQVLGQVWEGLVKGTEEHNRGSGLAQGLGAGELAAIFYSGRAMPEAKFAEQAGLLGRDVAKMTAEELEALGAKRIETVNGRHPLNWEKAGQVHKLEGELGLKYPEGVYFKETGYPDLTPYAQAEVKIKLTGKVTEEYAAADKLAGITKEERRAKNLMWHHHEDGTTMQLVPADLHKAVAHTGGRATSGLDYRR